MAFCGQRLPHGPHWFNATAGGVADCPGTAVQPVFAKTPPAPDPPEELVHVGWFCWRAGGHLATMACRSDCVPIHVPKEWVKDFRAHLMKLEDEPDE